MWSSLIGLPLSNNSMHTTYPRQKTWSVCFVFVNPCHYLWYSKQSLTWKLKLVTFKCLKLLLLIQVYDSPWYLSDLSLLQSLGTLLGTSDVFVLFLRLYSSLLSVFFFFQDKLSSLPIHDVTHALTHTHALVHATVRLFTEFM